MSDSVIPDLQSSLVCDDVRQERNGKFILIGIFEGILYREGAPHFPKLCLVNRWCCGSGHFRQHSRIVAPDGHTIVVEGSEFPIEFKNDLQTATSVEVFMNIKFPGSGTYWVEILLDQVLKMRYPLVVRPVAAVAQ